MNNEIEMFMGEFESIKEYSSDGVEIWRASKLMTLFEYTQWQKINVVIERAMNNFDGIIIDLYNRNGVKFNDSPAPVSRSKYVFDPNLHFIPIVRTVYSGLDNKTPREYPDYLLTRLACYAVAMEADNRKPAVRLAKQYLLLSVLEAEKMREQIGNMERIDMREAMTDYENSLESTYASHGVKKYGYVKSQGDAGFYNNPEGTKGVKRDLGIPNNKSLYDYMPIETMGFKLMGNIATKYGIINNNICGDQACAAEAFIQNNKQRNAMKEMTGIYPEDTMPDRNITDIRRDVKKVNSEMIKSSINEYPNPTIDSRVYTMVFEFNGYSYTLGQWCYLNNVEPSFILGLLDNGIPFEQAIFMRPNNKTSPFIRIIE